MWKYIGTKECNEFLLSLHLLNCKNEKKYIKILYSISNRKEKNYKIYTIKKRNGKIRTIYEPTPILKHIQTQILKNILENKKISKYATAYYKGASLKNNVTPHVNKEKILKLDVQDFFENISFINVYNTCFPIEYFPKSVGMLLTHLCTYHDHLIQGSPTSAYISNIVMKEFDKELGEWCNAKKISYTRYSDDMTFSGNIDSGEVITKVRELLSLLGLKLNNDKIHVIGKSSSQNVTGITVNEKVQVNRKFRNKIRQEVYYIEKFGLDNHLKRLSTGIDSKKYINQLQGKIAYVLQINENDLEFKEYKKKINDLKKQKLMNKKRTV